MTHYNFLVATRSPSWFWWILQIAFLETLLRQIMDRLRQNIPLFFGEKTENHRNTISYKKLIEPTSKRLFEISAHYQVQNERIHCFLCGCYPFHCGIRVSGINDSCSFAFFLHFYDRMLFSFSSANEIHLLLMFHRSC